MSFKGGGEIKLNGKTYDVEIKITEKSSKGFGINPNTIKIILGLMEAFKSGDYSNKSDMIKNILKLLNVMKQSTNNKVKTASDTLYDSLSSIMKL